MDHAKKLEFVHKMAKLGLQHFDGGGVISASQGNPLSGVSGALTTQNTYNAAAPVQAGAIGTQETGLSNQLQTEAAGGGPNPAQIQYQQNSQQIAQQQAALNAQNRALNPGLAARQSSNAAVQAEQTAAGGAAAQQAQQQLAAQGQEASLAGIEQQGLSSAQGINAQVSQNNTNAVQNTQGGILSSLPVVGSLFADGGLVKKYAGGGSIQVPGMASFSNANDLPDMQGGKSPNATPGGSTMAAPSENGALGANPFSIDGVSSASAAAPMSSVPALGSSAGIGAAASSPALAALAFAKGGKVAPMSHVGKWLNEKGPKKNQPISLPSPPNYPSPMLAGGGLMKSGGKVQPENSKQKASVKGDSFKNDKVPAMLSQGELVIDRDTMADPGPAGQMARALAKHIQAKKWKKS